MNVAGQTGPAFASQPGASRPAGPKSSGLFVSGRAAPDAQETCVENGAALSVESTQEVTKESTDFMQIKIDGTIQNVWRAEIMKVAPKRVLRANRCLLGSSPCRTK